MNEENKDLDYLNISLSVGRVLELAEQAKAFILEGKKSVSVAAFKNENAAENAPIYKGEGVVVWKNTKKVKPEDFPKVGEETI